MNIREIYGQAIRGELSAEAIEQRQQQRLEQAAARKNKRDLWLEHSETKEFLGFLEDLFMKAELMTIDKDEFKVQRGLHGKATLHKILQYLYNPQPKK